VFFCGLLVIFLAEDKAFTIRRKIPTQTISTPLEKGRKQENCLVVFVVLACGYSPNGINAFRMMYIKRNNNILLQKN